MIKKTKSSSSKCKVAFYSGFDKQWNTLEVKMFLANRHISYTSIPFHVDNFEDRFLKKYLKLGRNVKPLPLKKVIADKNNVLRVY